MHRNSLKFILWFVCKFKT